MMAQCSSLKGRVCGLFCLLILMAGCERASAPTPVEFVAGVNAERRYDAAQLGRGKAVFLRNCASCHGASGEGRIHPWNVRGADGFYPPPPLNDDAHAWHHSTKVLAKVIREGTPPNQGRMPAWQGKLTESEIADVVVYITSLWSGELYRQWYEQIEAPARRGELVR